MSKQRLWFVTYMNGNEGVAVVCNTQTLNKIKRLFHIDTTIEIKDSSQLTFYRNLIIYTLNKIDPQGTIRSLMVSPIQFEDNQDGRIHLQGKGVRESMSGYFK